MEKAYKVTHKAYYNDRLNKVLFHGKPTYPLYIQVTFDRKTIVFKSAFFELLSKPKYGMPHLGNVYGPELKEIILKEDAVIDYIVEKHKNDFSLDIFKDEYAHYTRDLLDEMEDGFRDYINTFFHDEGMPWLAVALREGSRYISPYNLVYDMKIGFSRGLYDKLVANSFHYAPPYFALYEFAMKLRQSKPVTLTLYEWAQSGVKERFLDFMNNNYAEENAIEILSVIKRRINK